jgi:putative Ca2+/H+ antiporter (TMEM165/GDT1 family)
MTSKLIALKVLDGIFVAVAIFLVLVAAGLPADWLLSVVGMSFVEFREFALFILFGTLLLIHAIATSDSAP